MKVKLEIEDNGKFYRYTGDDVSSVRVCTKTQRGLFLGPTIHGYPVYCERYHALSQLLAHCVRLLQRTALKHYSEDDVTCCPLKPNRPQDNRIILVVRGINPSEYPPRLLAMMRRMQELGIAFYWDEDWED